MNDLIEAVRALSVICEDLNQQVYSLIVLTREDMTESEATRHAQLFQGRGRYIARVRSLLDGIRPEAT